jgi:hypothetical protein
VGIGVVGVRAFAAALGVVEITLAVLIAMRSFAPRVSALGSIGAILMFFDHSELHVDHPRGLAAGLWLPVSFRRRTVPGQRRAAPRRGHLDGG